MKLNIGCGAKRLDGWVNIDIRPGPGVDLVGNLETGIVLDDGCANEILLDNVIEHIGNVTAAMNEIWRLAADGCRVRLITPHFSSLASWEDPTHCNHFALNSFDHFCCKSGRPDLMEKNRFSVAEKSLSFGGGIGLIGRLIYTINSRHWERVWSFMFRASTIRVTLVAHKQAGSGSPSEPVGHRR